jgi:hypothetical protein
MKRITVLLMAAALIGGAGPADAKHKLHQHKDKPTKVSQHKDNPTKRHSFWYHLWHPDNA